MTSQPISLLQSDDACRTNDHEDATKSTGQSCILLWHTYLGNDVPCYGISTEQLGPRCHNVCADEWRGIGIAGGICLAGRCVGYAEDSPLGQDRSARPLGRRVVYFSFCLGYPAFKCSGRCVDCSDWADRCCTDHGPGLWATAAQGDRARSSVGGCWRDLCCLRQRQWCSRFQGR